MIAKVVIALFVISLAFAQHTEEISSLYVHELPQNIQPPTLHYIPASREWKGPNTHVIKTDGFDTVDIEAPFKQDSSEYLLRGQYKPLPKSVAFFNYENLPGQQDIYVYNGTSDDDKRIYKQFSNLYEGTNYYISDVASSGTNSSTLVVVTNSVTNLQSVYHLDSSEGYSVIYTDRTNVQINYCKEEEFMIFSNRHLSSYNAATRRLQDFGGGFIEPGRFMSFNNICYVVKNGDIYQILEPTSSRFRFYSLVANGFGAKTLLPPGNDTNIHFTILDANNVATMYTRNGTNITYTLDVEQSALVSSVSVATYAPYYNQTSDPNTTFTYFFVYNKNNRYSLYRQNIGEKLGVNQFVAQLHPEGDDYSTVLRHNEIAYYAPLHKVLVVQIECRNATHASKAQLIYVDINANIHLANAVGRVDTLCDGECGLLANAQYMVQMKNGEVIVKRGDAVNGFRLHKIRWVEPKPSLLIPILGGVGMALIAILLIVGAILIHIIVRRRDSKYQGDVYEVRPILTN